MKGKYKGFSYPVYYAAVFILIAFSMLSGVLGKNTAAVIVCMLIAIAGGVGIIVLASNIPCHVRTDEKGFTITEWGMENRFEYDNVTEIEFKYVYTRYGAIIKLTINDKHMGEAVFREVCSQQELTELIGDPVSGKRPRLAQLCEYVKKTK